MTAIELQREYQSLVGLIAQKDTETMLKAVQALRKVLDPKKHKAITKADLIVDPRVVAMTRGVIPPSSFDYSEERYNDYMNGE